MTKSQFITYLEGIYLKVATPVVKQQADENNTKWYTVNVVENGNAENEDPVIYRKNVDFYVVDEGEATEKAGFSRIPKLPSVNTSVKDTSGTLEAIDKLFRSSEIESRVRAAVLTAAKAVFFEDAGTASHVERLKWSAASMKNPDTYTTQMMSVICLESNVQTAGSQVTDSILQNHVNGWVTNFAVQEFGA